MGRSIVMVDWSRFNQPTQKSRDEFLWHQILLSILYDDVLAQDETLLCSEKLADWFPDSESFRLLEQLVDCGGLCVLKRPWQAYPKDLQELATQQPIAARRAHLEGYSAYNDGTRVCFSKKQLAFQNRLEALLSTRPRAHRFAGSRSKSGVDVMQQFAKLLARVLADPRYEKWLRRKFPNISQKTTEKFIKFVEYPNLAIERIIEAGQQPRFTPQPGDLVLSTALAVQAAATYAEEAEHLQNLIETVFARPFCEREDAEGRYGDALRDLPYTVDVNHAEEVGNLDAVKVRVPVKVSVGLPSPGIDFADIIEGLRAKDSVKELRRAMQNLVTETNLRRAEDAWTGVSADLASMLASGSSKEINVWMLMIEAGRGVFASVMADFSSRPTIDDLPHRLFTSAAGALLDVAGGMFVKVARADLERQRITPLLEEAVKFQCVPHPAIAELESRRATISSN
jgi:hypothetical protein